MCVKLVRLDPLAERLGQSIVQDARQIAALERVESTDEDGTTRMTVNRGCRLTT